MSKKKGLSVEEKRTRMMELFYERKDFFQLKELEKICPKEKGITSMTVKEILMSLVDDGMVDTDKIGTCVYFWAFPSKASQIRKRKIEDLSNSLADIKKRKLSSEKSLSREKIGKEDTEKRGLILEELSTKRLKLEELTQELERFKECDPEVLEAMKQEILTAKDAANRWTDNVFAIKSWIRNKFCFEGSVIDKQFGIPEDFDYIE